jgi:hypothetical protein
VYQSCQHARPFLGVQEMSKREQTTRTGFARTEYGVTTQTREVTTT